MLNEAMSFALNDAKTPALKTVSRVCRKNGNEDGRSTLLKLAHLAWMAVQHEGAKQGNYDASLYFFGGLGNDAGVWRASGVHEGFFDTD